MSNSAITKHFERPEIVVDTTTVFDDSGVTAGPSFNLGVRQGLEYSIQIDWRNNTGDIDVLFYGRTKVDQNYMSLELHDTTGSLINSIKISETTGTHMIHFDRKFNDIDVRFVVNSGQADVQASVIIE